MTTYAYTRVSTTAQSRDGESLEVQQRQLTGWAMMNDTKIDRVIVDAGVSGSVSVADRPEGSKMIARLRRGDVVVAVKLDRMFRSARDALNTVEDLKDRGVSLILLDLGGDVMGNGLAKLFLTMTAAFAEVERDRIRERIQGHKRDAKARGRYLGGKIPFGYVVENGALVEVAEEAAIIQKAKTLRSAKQSLRAIQKAVQEDHGRRLALETINRITA